MTHPQHFLFAVWMVGGIQTVFHNLKEAVGEREVTRTSWLPIEMYPDDWITKVPPISFYGMWRNAMATWMRIRPLEHQGGDLDAAYFLEHSIIPPFWSFSKRVPYLLSTDMTPLFCARHKLWYAVPEFDPWAPLSRVKQWATKPLYQGAFHLLPWSTGVRDSMIEDYGVPEDRVTILPPGINLKLWRPPDRSMSRDVSSPFKVLHVGWDFQRKGGDLLVALASEPEFQDVEFHFVTSGVPGPIPENVKIHRDVQPNSPALIELYRQADIFVLPTRADTYSMVSLEAMAMSLPVITTSVGGIGDIIVEGETGYCIEPNDIGALRDRLRRVRQDRALRLAMGQKGRKRVEERFDLIHHTETVLDLLDKAARSGAERRNR
jgi:glycosyltransferase involved in cell wall biosynthesis